MASFTYFDGKDAAPVSMAGGKKGRRSHTDKMRELRKERADREMARRCADAAGVVQRWIRGSRSRASTRATVLALWQRKAAETDRFQGTVPTQHLFDLCRLFCQSPPHHRRAQFPTLAGVVACSPGAFRETCAADPLLFLNTCIKIGQAVAATQPPFARFSRVLSLVLDRGPFEAAGVPEYYDTLQKAAIRHGVFAAIHRHPLDERTAGLVRSVLYKANWERADGRGDRAFDEVFFVEGALLPYTKDILGTGLARRCVELELAAPLKNGAASSEPLRWLALWQDAEGPRDAAMQVEGEKPAQQQQQQQQQRLVSRFFAAVRAALAGETAARAGVLREVSEALPRFVARCPVDDLLRLLGFLLEGVSAGWMAQHVQSLYVLQPEFGRRVIRHARDEDSLRLVCRFYAAMLSRCRNDLEGRAAILAVLAFSDERLLPSLWSIVRPKLPPGSVSVRPVHDPEINDLLYIFALAAGHYQEVCHIDDMKAFLDIQEVTRCLINYGTRCLFYEPPSDVVRDAVLSLLRKLHDWNTREQFLPPGDWLVTPPWSWPTQISLNDWLSHRVCPPIFRTFMVLQNVPFIIPFDARVLMFRSFVEQDIEALGFQRGFEAANGNEAHIRRDRIFEDGFKAVLSMHPDALKGMARVAFISREGVEEAGFGDGVFKEFLTELCKIAFNPSHGLFLLTDTHEMYPNPAAGEEFLYGAGYLDRYRFLGRVLGKALYEGILIDLPLTRFFRNALLDHPNTLHDLSSLDAELYKNLVALKHMSEEEVASLGLVFAVTVDHVGVAKTIEFFPGGGDVPVTIDNRMKYIHMMSHYKLTAQVSKHVAAMREGMQEVISPSWLRMFDANELHILLCGHDSDAALDIDDWEANTVYGGGYHHNHHTIRLFWQTVRRHLDAKQQRRLLKFVTSVDRAPLLGFKYLHPRFCIHMGGDVERLPSASTCMCLLKLPPYANAAQMRQSLTTALEHDTGFELS